MESPKPVSRYVARNSKKRVFPGGSSSSEVEVLEMPPPVINRASKSKSSKQKEVIRQEIIDVDMDEDSGNIDHIDGDIGSMGKGKEALSNFSAGLSDLVTNGSRNDIKMSNKGSVEEFNSNMFCVEDDWIDKYYDDIAYDDYAVLQSHFDHMHIPSGVEVPIPWLGPQNNTKVPVTGTSTSSSSQIELNGASITHGLHSSDSSLPLQHTQFKDLTTSVPPKIGSQAAHNTGLLSLGKSKKRSHIYSSTQKQFTSHRTPLSIFNNHSDHPNLSIPSMGQDSPLNMLEPSMGPSVTNGSAFASLVQNFAYSPNGTTSAGVEPRNVDEILQNFDRFKKFDTVEDYSDHHYSKQGSRAKQPSKNWAKRIQEEWKLLEKDLPDTIYVRVYESRMDLLRAVIVGAEGTPYHDGLFFFDVFFPSAYPNVPPQVHYHSGGLRINPNLYNCGKVCLSLLNTWSGSSKEKWIPFVSTMLQVLVSIQGLILNAKPFFNEPGYAHSSGTTYGENQSLEYNESTFMLSLQTMVYNMRRPPKHFEAYVVGHFYKHAREILVSCKAYLDGAQVGCLVKGGVQDVDEGDKSCSQHFRTNLAGFLTTLVNEFSKIGAKDCQEFLSLSQKANGRVTAAPRS